MSDVQLVSCQLRMPDQSQFAQHITENAHTVTRVATANSHVGQSVVICGAGPSLADECTRLPLSDQVWACNSALPYLVDRGVRVTHGFCIDQGEAMLGADEWERTFAVEYLVASSVHPKLVDHLWWTGRRVRFFHNYLGIDGERALYDTLYPTSVQVGHGLNAVPRAVCLALAMGFASITVVGADCGVADQPAMPPMDSPEYATWMSALPMYASGRTAACFGVTQSMAEAPDLHGRRWHTRPDMVVSARHLLDLESAFPGRITLVGDTLPNAMRGQHEWLADLPELTATGEVIGFGRASENPHPILEAVA